MIRKEINLSEVLEYFKKNKIESFDEEIDKFGSYFMTAGRIAAIILAPTPLVAIEVFCLGLHAATFRASELLSWLPDKFKYKDRGREKFAVDRYELSSVVNYMLLHIAIKNSIKEVIMPVLSAILEHIQLEEADKKDLEKLSKACDLEMKKLSLPANCSLTKDDIGNYAFKIIDPILPCFSKIVDKCKEEKKPLKKIDLLKTKEKYLENIHLYYNAFVISFSGEFPEFALWSDITQKAAILEELKNTTKAINSENRIIHTNFLKQIERTIKLIEEFRNGSYINESGFPSFINSYKELFQLQTDSLIKSLSAKIRENVEVHQNKIRAELNKPLIDNADIEGIVYPKNKDIYIAQSFRSIDYKKKEHKKGFLTDSSLGDKWIKGENISNYLLQTLIDPNYSNQPIILLGLPGAGKSMLSKMFAGQLCETTDFIPFLIKLRSVASNTANISEHINKGIAKSIESNSDINWLDWAKEFKERIPVIIMDGFDELMQSSSTELNNYVGTIKEFQDTALLHGIAVRIILTSRTTVMQDVYIPEGTRIIKLDSFDAKRRDLWVNLWNDKQTKLNYKFSIPKNQNIEILAQEPLLIFMLAVYDFEKSELQHMTKDKNFNQSKLYDSLLISFIERQLKKNELFTNANPQQQDREKDLFRLRLGMIALMMFLNDSTNKDTQKLPNELETFGLIESKIQTDNILGGFFFIHQNKSTTEGDAEKLNYEFLHKTFGEFLAADFLLRVALKQCERSREKICQPYIFKFCFGYNWLHKHHEIQNFLFEHASQIIKSPKEIEQIINDIIKHDIESLFVNGNVDFPVKENQIQPHKQVVEHLGIYSQNLIFLWLAISNEKGKIKFEIFGDNEKTGEGTSEPKYESQDRDEINKNKLLWKRLAKLWTLVGNYNATAKLNEWINVEEKDNNILLSKAISKVIHNFSDSAKVACNDFELLLSFFDNEYKFSNKNNTLKIVQEIITKKPELSSLAFDAIIHRFQDLFSVEGLNLLEWFKRNDLSKKQQISLLRKIGALKWHFTPERLSDLAEFVTKDTAFIYWENLQATIEYMKIVIALKYYFPKSASVYYEIFPDILRRSIRDIRHTNYDNIFPILEYITLLNEFKEYSPINRKYRIEFLDESLHLLSRDIRHLKMNPYSAFEYVKLLNELMKQYPRRINPELIEEALYTLSKESKYILRENPHIIMEYLKLILDVYRHTPMRENLLPTLFEEPLKYLSSTELDDFFKENSSYSLEYLKILVEFKQYYSIEKIFPFELIEQPLNTIFHELRYSIRENPDIAFEYLNIIKELQYLYSWRENVPYKKRNMFNEFRSRLIKEVDIDFRGNPLIALVYLELSLMSHSHPKYDEHDIERLVFSLVEGHYGVDIIKRAMLLLIEYKAKPALILRLLENYPKMREIFMRSPEIAKDMFEAMAELNTYEKIN